MLLVNILVFILIELCVLIVHQSCQQAVDNGDCPTPMYNCVYFPLIPQLEFLKPMFRHCTVIGVIGSQERVDLIIITGIVIPFMLLSLLFNRIFYKPKPKEVHLQLKGDESRYQFQRLEKSLVKYFEDITENQQQKRRQQQFQQEVQVALRNHQEKGLIKRTLESISERGSKQRPSIDSESGSIGSKQLKRLVQATGQIVSSAADDIQQWYNQPSDNNGHNMIPSSLNNTSELSASNNASKSRNMALTNQKTD